MNKKIKKLIVVANHKINGRIQLVCAANELQDVGGNWYEIAYGQYQHSAGLQFIEQSDAIELKKQFDQARATDPAYLAPFYIGHPDHPTKEEREEWPDKAAYGWIDQVAATSTGFRFHVEWTPEGKKLLENKSYRYFSPLFWLHPERVDGRRVIRPRIFQSVGLTNTPNMAGCWVGNSDLTKTQGEPSMNLLDRLKALLNKEDVQTEDDIVNIFQKMVDALKKLRDAQKDKWEIEEVAYDVAENSHVVDNALQLIAGIDAAVAAANSAIPAETATEVETLKTQIEDQAKLVTAANSAAATALVDLAIAQGKVLEADKATKIEELTKADDLVTAGNSLLSGEPVIKVAPTTANLKLADMAPLERREARIAAANSVQKEYPALTSVQAWGRAKKMQKFTHLFADDKD